MNCMRCGVETTEKQVFCPDCLAFMEQYPVKPGTPIYLPQRTQAADDKKPAKKKRENAAEEQITRLRKLVRHLTLGLMAALLMIAMLAGTLLFLSTQEEPQTTPGKNYTATEGR